MKGKIIGWAIFLVAVLAVVMLAGHPVALPRAAVTHPGTSLTDFNPASYRSCSSSSAPCLAYLNTGNYPTTAKAYDQDCDDGEFDGVNNSNLDSKGKTIDDGWLFVARANVNYYDIKATFTDSSHNTQTVTFPGTANPPTEPSNAANIYFTKNYSHIAVLTPPGWTLTGATGLMAGNHSSTFELSHTCAAQTSGGGTNCNYPPNNSWFQVWKTPGNKPNTYNVSGTLTQDGCPVPCQKVWLWGNGSHYSAWVNTDNDGKFTFPNIPKGYFQVLLSFLGNGTWPPGSIGVH